MIIRAFCVLIASAAACIAAEWRALSIETGSLPPEIVSEDRAAVSDVSQNGLPDGLVITGERDIAAAWYEAPTRRYAHAILGDAVEAGSLVVQLASGETLTLDLPDHQVFEDRYPRLADLDQDGSDEVITIRSSRSGGGGVAIYGIREGRLKEISHVPDIGLANRWLNIAGIADFHPHPGLEIAFVKTPHIGGTLRLFGWAEGALTLLAEDWGYSNHFIGSPEMRLSALADLNGDGFADMALPSEGRRRLKLVTFTDGIDVIGEVRMSARIDKAIGRIEGGFVVGTSDGLIHLVARE